MKVEAINSVHLCSRSERVRHPRCSVVSRPTCRIRKGVGVSLFIRHLYAVLARMNRVRFKCYGFAPVPSNNFLASSRSRVPKPSVNRPTVSSNIA
jgi:hypothetical protein